MKADASLFCEEERIIADAEALVGRSEERLSAWDYSMLLAHYKRLYRQSARLVKMSDRMQGQLNRLNEDLTRSEEKYRRIFEESMQGIYSSSTAGRFLDCNPAMSRILGYDSPEALCGEVRDIGAEIYLSPSHRNSLLHTLRQNKIVTDYPLQLRRPDGGLIWVELSTRGVFDAEGVLVEMEGLVADVTQKRCMLEKLKNLARRDGLTGLWNRRYFMELGRREMHRADREGTPLSIVYLDADHFKRINDTYGHDAGDQVLKDIAAMGTGLLRQLDIFGRMGGEEFAILLPDATVDGAAHVAEKLRTMLEINPMRLPCGSSVRVTASFGVAQLDPDCPCLERLVTLADKALYEAKHDGRNRVVCARPCPQPSVDRSSVPRLRKMRHSDMETLDSACPKVK